MLSWMDFFKWWGNCAIFFGITIIAPFALIIMAALILVR